MPILLFAVGDGNKNVADGKLASADGNMAGVGGKRIRKEKR